MAVHDFKRCKRTKISFVPVEEVDPDDLQDEHVTETECVQVWGPRSPQGGFQFDETHPDKSLNLRIQELWSAIYHLDVQEFGLSFGKAVLAERKGIRINWGAFAVKTDATRTRKLPRKKMQEKSISAINADVNSEVPKRKKASAPVARNDGSVSLNEKNQMNKKNKKSKEEKGKMPMTAPGEDSEAQVENWSDVNEELMQDYSRLGQEVHGPGSSAQYTDEEGDEARAPFTRSQAQREEDEARQASEADTHRRLDSVTRHPGIDERLEGLATSMSAYESLLRCTQASKANLQRNIDDALSTCAECEGAIAAFRDLCRQQAVTDEAIVDSTHRLRDTITRLQRSSRGAGGVRGDAESMARAMELDDATMWHNSLLEERVEIGYKIEATADDVEEKKFRLKAANEALLGLLLQHYRMFGKDGNVVDSMQRQLNLLHHGFDVLKARVCGF